jgi:hypothetical protein
MQRCKKKSVYIFIPLIDNEKQIAISVSRLDIEIKQPSIPTDQGIPPDSPVYKQTARFIVLQNNERGRTLRFFLFNSFRISTLPGISAASRFHHVNTASLR